MSHKVYEDNFVRPNCSQVQNSSYQFSPILLSAGVNSSYNQQSIYESMYGPQGYRSQNNLSYSDQMDCANWIPDSRAVAEIEKGLKLTDKMEAIEITSKDLSPASCCSAIDLLFPDVHKSLNKETNYCNKPVTSDLQLICSSSYNQKYVEYPSCSQMNMTLNEDNSRRYCNVQRSYEFNTKTRLYTESASSCYLQPCDNISDKTYLQNSIGNMFTHNMYNSYDNRIQDFCLPQGDFIPENNLFCGERAVYPDVCDAEYRPDISNDGSDIIVEESEEEVTDWSEDFERLNEYATNCVICNALYSTSGSQFYILTTETPLTMSSQKPVYVKLTEIVGLIVNKRKYLCSQCLGLINTIDHLELNLENTKYELFNKYENTCKFNNLVVDNQNVKINSVEHTHKKVKNCHQTAGFKCKLCRKKFSLKRIYYNHMLNHKLRNKFLCEYCGRTFSKHCKFKVHVRFHRQLKCNISKKIDGFVCTICNKLFRTGTKLREHHNFCSGKLPFKCKMLNCDKKFASVTKLKNHVKLKHDKKFLAICSICNIGFVKMSGYKSHMTSHSTEKKYNCSKCEKSYKTMSNLNYHMKCHNDVLPFICQVCNKGFMRKEYLEAHVNLHKSVKNFSCQMCCKKFASQKNLDAHVKYHDGNVKTKTCNICGKVTIGLEHMRIHSNLKEFECEECSLRFNTKGALAKHKKRKQH